MKKTFLGFIYIAIGGVAVVALYTFSPVNAQTQLTDSQKETLEKRLGELQDQVITLQTLNVQDLNFIVGEIEDGIAYYSRQTGFLDTIYYTFVPATQVLKSVLESLGFDSDRVNVQQLQQMKSDVINRVQTRDGQIAQLAQEIDDIRDQLGISRPGTPSGTGSSKQLLSPIPGVGRGASDLTETSDLNDYVKAVYYFGIVLASLFALVSIVYAGIVITTSSGNAAKVSDAKEIITQSILGVLLLLGAVIILNTINTSVLNTAEIGAPAEQAPARTIGEQISQVFGAIRRSFEHISASVTGQTQPVIMGGSINTAMANRHSFIISLIDIQKRYLEEQIANRQASGETLTAEAALLEEINRTVANLETRVAVASTHYRTIYDKWQPLQRVLPNTTETFTTLNELRSEVVQVETEIVQLFEEYQALPDIIKTKVDEARDADNLANYTTGQGACQTAWEGAFIAILKTRGATEAEIRAHIQSGRLEQSLVYYDMYKATSDPNSITLPAIGQLANVADSIELTKTELLSLINSYKSAKPATCP